MGDLGLAAEARQEAHRIVGTYGDDPGCPTVVVLNRLANGVERLQKQVDRSYAYREAVKESFALMVKRIAGLKHSNKRQRRMTNAARHQLGKSREALKFYAFRSNHVALTVELCGTLLSAVDADGGEIARAVLPAKKDGIIDESRVLDFRTGAAEIRRELGITPTPECAHGVRSRRG